MQRRLSSSTLIFVRRYFLLLFSDVVSLLSIGNLMLMRWRSGFPYRRKCGEIISQLTRKAEAPFLHLSPLFRQHDS